MRLVGVVPQRLHEAFAQREGFKKAINVLSGDNDSAPDTQPRSGRLDVQG
jgi:hypothetical protein